MANFIDTSNLNYCGKEANEIFSKQIYDLDLRSYGVRFMDNVKGKTKLYDGTMGEAFQAYTCPFSPNGKVVLKESFIEPARLKVNMENCFDGWDDTYFVEQTKITLDGGIPQTFADWFFGELVKEMGKEYHEIFWKGNTTYTGATKAYLKVTNGVEAILEADTAVTKIDGAAFTIDNIIAQVEAAVTGAINQAADEEVDMDTYKIFMNINDVRLLEAALGKECSCNLSTSVFKNYTKEGDKIYVMGLEVVRTLQSRNSVIVGPANNLVLGYDTFDSHTEYKIIDMRETTGDNMFRVLALTNIAVGVVLPALFTYSRVKA